MDAIQKSNVLIIDDDEGVVRTIIKAFRKLDINLEYSHNLLDGLKKIDKNDFDAIFLDVNLPDGNGIDKIPYIMDRIYPPLVIIMTAYSDPDGAELAIESGAWDYLQKPISPKNLNLQLSNALKFQEQKKQNAKPPKFEPLGIIGRSTAIQKCLTQASQIVYSDANVLITGETGTGKELFAKAIHDNSARRNG
jgi:two-component system, NtrC family, response regulator